MATEPSSASPSAPTTENANPTADTFPDPTTASTETISTLDASSEATDAALLITKIAAATQQYALKNYDAAADLYSEAVTLQAAAHGEMALQNADLLYAYGRCLYHVAVDKSDVLGGRVAGEDGAAKKRKRGGAGGGSGSGAGVSSMASAPAERPVPAKETQVEAVLERVVEAKEGVLPTPKASATPYFTITGDENWDDSDDSDVDAEGHGEGADADAEEAAADEEEDDFATAYEILDLARVLLARRLEAEENDDDGAAGGSAALTDAKDKGKGRATVSEDDLARRQLQERLADTHDLQAEISLENERFTDAITDSRAALELKRALYAPESSIVAEAHFKLSLALEFASVTAPARAEDGVGGGAGGGVGAEAQVDEGMRAEAAAEMEAAIRSSKMRVEKETAALAAFRGEEAVEKRKGIEEVKEIIGDMEQRLIDLRSPAVSLNGLTGPAGAPVNADPLRGVLGSILGESAAVQKARIEDAVKGANDLTASIRHKKKAKVEDVASTATAAVTNGTGKRKAEDEQMESDKKAKVEDA